jgi:hypothetical protein
MKTPENRYVMKHDMLKIYGKIEHQDYDYSGYPIIYGKLIKQPPLPFFSDQGAAYGSQWEEQTDNQSVYQSYRKIYSPSFSFWRS